MRTSRYLPITTFLLVSLAVWSLHTQGADTPTKRQPWTTSKIVGNPEPPPKYKLPVAFPNLKFNHPVLLTQVPGTNRLIVAEQDGKIFTFENRPDTKAELFFDTKKETQWKTTKDATQFDATYGLVFDPNFAKNRYCYLCYTVKGKAKNLEDGSRVSRFQVKPTEPPTLDAASEEILLTFLQGGHNGGDLHFGNDGYLYISTGDATDPNPPDGLLHTGQDVSDLLSSVLRIDVHKQEDGKKYAIPKDNPFVGQKHNGKPIRGEVWAYGFRNPWRMGFDRKTGDLWLGDVGWEAWEMIHKIEKGGNYGWSIKEANQTVNMQDKLGPTPIRPPAIELSHAIAASITGGYVYRGKKFPDLEGKYIFGDWMTRRIWAAKFNGAELISMEEITAPSLRIIAFGEDTANELYLLDYDTGTVHTLVPNETANSDPAKFPRLLSQTGLFAETPTHKPAAGIYPFDINSKQWQDYATSEYLLALPENSTATYYDDKKPFANDVTWNPIHLHLPKNGVLVKTISLEMERGNPTSKKRIETQLLHFDGDALQGYTYAWRDDQSDAELVPADGGEKSFTVKDKFFGGVRPQTWTFASRVQCGQCHNPWAGYMLAFNPDQLHRTLTSGESQLSTMCKQGLIQRVGKNDKPLGNFSEDELKKMRKLTDHADAKQPAVDRARSYLNANCGHCHRFGGGGAVEFHLNLEADIKNEKLWNAKPARGDLGIPNARILAPGDPERSILYYRMSKFGSGRMPHLGSELPDEAGLKLVHDWIASLGTSSTAHGPFKFDKAKLPEQLQGMTDAMRIARAVGAGDLPTESLTAIREAVSDPSCGTAARELLGGYFPDPNKPATLGANPRPRVILSLKGDPVKGKELFFAQRSTCATCHKIDGQGLEVGPDLSHIAKTRTREQLLESILDPSRRIEQQFQSYQVVTISGKSLSGILIKRDAKELVLKDAQNKQTTIPADDVEIVNASRTSLMPEGLLKNFTPQEAADLLAYLAARK